MSNDNIYSYRTSKKIRKSLSTEQRFVTVVYVAISISLLGLVVWEAGKAIDSGLDRRGVKANIR